MKRPEIILPDYKNCIANLPNSILKKFNAEPRGDSLPLLDRYLTHDYKNIIVFLLVGIWHGIESHYILWGLYNGIVIAVSSLLQPTFHQLSLKLKMNTEGRGFHIFRVVRTFIIVNIGWYFDRIVNLKDCMICFRNTFAHFQISSLLPFFQTYGVVRFAIVAIACILVFFVSADKEHGKDVVSVVRGQHALVRYSLLTVCPLLILYSCSIVNHPVGFMYANF